MKKTLLLTVLALGILSINVSAQTKKQSTAQRTTTSRSTNSQQGGQVMKFKQVGEDGYVWYKLKRGNLCGARDAEGNNIIPIKFDDVTYVCKIEKYAHTYGTFSNSRQDGKHFFKVTKGKAKGAYTREGRMVISTDKNYDAIDLNIEWIHPCWTVSTQDSKFINGILDMKGNIVIQPGKYKSAIPFYCGINITDYNEKDGICDWNGNIVIPCQYETCFVLYEDGEYKLTYRESENAELKNKIISFDTSSRFDYQTYDNLCYNYDASSFNSSLGSSPSSSSSSSSSASSSSSSSSNSNNNSSGNGTTTVVIEHQHTPQPMQEWQQCNICYGDGKCHTYNCTNGWNYGTKTYCLGCGGNGRCHFCNGQGGRYITVYR